jgi:hypothetical protein
LQEGQYVPKEPDAFEMVFNFVNNLSVSPIAFYVTGGLLMALGFGMAVSN